MQYRSFSEEMQRRFGCKVYKLSLDGGMTCPNRDGRLDTRGCIFCSGRGSGDFAAPSCLSISQQLEAAKTRVARKNRDGKYIAYFQSFSNTYQSAEYLTPLFWEAISQPEVVALSIATRPDCLKDDVLELLRDLGKVKPVWVELGLQTIHPETARYIRRGYDLSVYDEAVLKLKSVGAEVIAHQILGLPNETVEMMVQTARYIGRSGADGIKLQLLHVLEGTDLAEEYRRGQAKPLALEDYITILEGCIKSLPPWMVIHRLTGDGGKGALLAPLWSGDKKRVLNRIRERFLLDNLVQGSAYEEGISVK